MYSFRNICLSENTSCLTVKNNFTFGINILRVFIIVTMQARRALRALRGLVRLKSLVEGNSVKRQSASTLRCMQTLSRVQSQIRSRRAKMSEENQALQRQLLLKQELKNFRVC
jgi:hypothetical protein